MQSSYNFCPLEVLIYLIVIIILSSVTVVVSTITQGPTDISAMLGKSVTFTCTATGNPRPDITWTDQDGNMVGMTSDMVINVITIQSTLTLSNLQDEDFDNYTCTATNIFGSDSVTALLGSELVIHVR